MIIQKGKRHLEYQRPKFGSHLTIKAIYKQCKNFLPCHLSLKGENITKPNILLWRQTITSTKCSYSPLKELSYNTKTIQVINGLTMMNNDDGDDSRKGMHKHIYIM